MIFSWELHPVHPLAERTVVNTHQGTGFTTEVLTTYRDVTDNDTLMLISVQTTCRATTIERRSLTY